MGKDLRGKELGAGIYQRKDGRYYARFRSISGKRPEKGFDKLTDARKWLAEKEYEDSHGDVANSNKVTLDAWFDYMISVKSDNLHPSTIKTYKSRYDLYVRKKLGHMLLEDIRPPQCQKIISDIQAKGHYATAKSTWVLLAMIFNFAVGNRMISQSPVTSVVQYNKEKSKPKKTKVLSELEQSKLIEYMKSIGSAYLTHFCFILQTGVRLGELIGLKWSDVDWVNRTIHIRRSTSYDFKLKKFVDGPPKYEASDRIIPLTDEAYTILRRRKAKNNGQLVHFECCDYVFLNAHGKMSAHGVYEKALKNYCINAGITVVTPHGLRHTFATRGVESEMRPKNLQKIMGHERIGMTMDLYVHSSEEGIINDMKKLSASGF